MKRLRLTSIAAALLWGAAGICDAGLIYPKPPEGGKKIALENTARFLRDYPGSLSEKGLRVEDLAVASPFLEYYAYLTDVTSGQLLSAAKPGAWRYLLLHAGNAVGSAELIVPKKAGAGLKFYALSKDDSSAAMLKALRIARQLPQVQKEDYEVRGLGIAPLLFTALWLHGKTGDIIIPLPPTFGRWKAYKAFPVDEITRLLLPEVKRKMSEPPGTYD